ncbi:uncharacterized protein MELLADRAFT_96219 [Melampsora larici-populina 98AG31]|uniref:Uncharacterized protein n=1 Tax=Melampsora larici-populina (strain 98AG31 / pathotype 3-4-7) TaxID=747676 RepID=F4SBD9_MELLP|nr:uncharacterized protein MELLADRAFT_96219 [Melampsora larici-populina 98AG31]EGF98048.1 hypothetical protein MELLADRAFT_96219 [Melampsora larici-populina 98AG31]
MSNWLVHVWSFQTYTACFPNPDEQQPKCPAFQDINPFLQNKFEYTHFNHTHELLELVKPTLMIPVMHGGKYTYVKSNRKRTCQSA